MGTFVADDVRLCGVVCCMIRIVYGVSFGDRVGVVMKIEDMIIQSRKVGMVMSWVETSILKNMRLWKLK